MALALATFLMSLGAFVLGFTLAFIDLFSQGVFDSLSRYYVALGGPRYARPKGLGFEIVVIAARLVGTAVVLILPGSVFMFLARRTMGEALPRELMPLGFGVLLLGGVCGVVLRRKRARR